MPQLLVVGQNDAFCLDVEAVAESCGAFATGLRIKSTTSIEIAETWLELGGFSGVVFDPKLEFNSQSKLAAVLWRKDILAPFILYGPSSEGKRDAEARLLGSEPFTGKEAKTRLGNTLNLLAQISLKPGGDTLLKVAVVEDLDSPRDIICTYLEGVDNLQTFGFESVDAVLEAIENEPGKFDMILTDLRMPKRSGTELIATVRANPKIMKMPIIVLTAYGTADVMMDCLKEGATGFMVKPPRKKDLKHEIARVRRILRFKLDPRLVFPNEIEKMREILATKGFF